MPPDPAVRPPLDKQRLSALSPDAVPDLTVEVLDETGSTNEVARERALAGAPDGLVVVADHQTAGRGRLDRRWASPPGTSVTFSMLVRPSAPTRSWPWLPLLTGYAVAKTLTAMGYAAGLKWPNDVLVGETSLAPRAGSAQTGPAEGRKVAGVLLERVETDQGPAAVLGVGLNVDMTEDELPDPGATALSLEQRSADVPAPPVPGEEPLDRTEILVAVLSSVRETYDAWQAGGDMTGMRLAESYASACVTVGRDVRVDLPDGRALVGRAVGIDPGGQLVVDTAAGRQRIGAGDVLHVRPAGASGAWAMSSDGR